MRRVVIDASTLLRALTGHPEAASALLLSAVVNRTVEAAACPDLIDEVRVNLRDNRYFAARITRSEALRAVRRIERRVIMFEDPVNPQAIIRDSTASSSSSSSMITHHRTSTSTPDVSDIRESKRRVSRSRPAQ